MARPKKEKVIVINPVEVNTIEPKTELNVIKFVAENSFMQMYMSFKMANTKESVKYRCTINGETFELTFRKMIE